MIGQYSFDEFLLDGDAGLLRRGDVSIDLRPKVYELLLFLVRNRGRLILKQELLDAIWGEIHVSDGSLNRTVADLRRALGDDPRAPRLIETVARRGYRFIAAVKAGAQSADLSQFVLLIADRIVTLQVGENIVGRTPECDVQIVGPSVSRRHARILITADEAAIEDLGSLNGTFVGDRRITGPEPLRGGDQLRIGKERLRVIADGALRALTEPAV